MNPLYDCGEATKNLQCGIAWHLGQARQGAAIYNVSTEGGVGPRHPISAETDPTVENLSSAFHFESGKFASFRDD